MDKKVLIFDCFGVVVSSLLGRWVKDVSIYDSLPDEFFVRIDKGEISEQDALLQLSKLVNRDSKVVRKEIDSYFEPNTTLIDFIKKLRSKGYKIILLSNASHSFFERFVFVEHPWFAKLFDDIIISSAVKMIKPNSDIYLYTLKKNNLKPENTIFIDDNEDNIVGAQKVGIPSIVFKNTEQMKGELLLRFNVN
jgi:HAD superfamily hydrolase (TIGR01509 family)